VSEPAGGSGSIDRALSAFEDALLRGDSPLSRAQRELIALVVATRLRAPVRAAQHAQAFAGELHDHPAEDRERFLAALVEHWPSAGVHPRDAALCSFAERATEDPARLRELDVVELRRAGFSDRAIHDATQVLAFANHVCRAEHATRIGALGRAEPPVAPEAPRPGEARP
jgi:uncharacterized peroxidase-related enzyme